MHVRRLLQTELFDRLLAEHKLLHLAAGRQGVALLYVLTIWGGSKGCPPFFGFHSGEVVLPWMEELLLHSGSSANDTRLHFSALSFQFLSDQTIW